MEHLTPHTGLFEEQQLWWEDLFHPGLYFVRGMQPYQGEDPRSTDHHNTFPIADGPRGIGWVSAYIQGRCDSAGRLVFAELAGRVGWLLPNGEVYTLAGWVLAPGKLPGWVRKPLDAVRGNQVLRGSGAAFQSGGPDAGFGRPMDVAFDDADPAVIYVSDLTKHVIWRLTLQGIADFSDLSQRPSGVDVEVLAGSPGAAGFADGPAAAARFNQPFGLTLARGALFVSDSANHAVRRVNPASGAVTTLWGGGPGFGAVLASRGVGDVQGDQAACRGAMRVAVSAADAAAGLRPEVYWPAALRATSSGHLVLLEHGIRRIDPDTHVATVLADVDQKFEEYDHGWAWLDVDTTGATGPMDGVWWCKAVGETISGDTGSHFNEVFAWTPPEGGGSKFVFRGRGGGADPNGWGPKDYVTVPHYPWLVAVSPRGAVLLAGMGGHGVTRVRLRQDGDPEVVTTEDNWDYYRGSALYNNGAMLGPLAYPLSFRTGHGGHNVLGLRSGDAYATRGLSDAALTAYYGVPSALMTDAEDRRRCILTYLRRNAGPARDGLPASVTDTSPPSAPGPPRLTRFALYGGLAVRWDVSVDDAAVLGYALQIATDDAFSRFIPGYEGAFLGSTDVVVAEFKAPRRTTLWVRLRAVDLAGNLSPWSPVARYSPA